MDQPGTRWERPGYQTRSLVSNVRPNSSGNAPFAQLNTKPRGPSTLPSSPISA